MILSMRTPGGKVIRGRWGRSMTGRSPTSRSRLMALLSSSAARPPPVTPYVRRGSELPPLPGVRFW
jgi:hypothetical protein